MGSSRAPPSSSTTPSQPRAAGLKMETRDEELFPSVAHLSFANQLGRRLSGCLHCGTRPRGGQSEGGTAESAPVGGLTARVRACEIIFNAAPTPPQSPGTCSRHWQKVPGCQPSQECGPCESPGREFGPMRFFFPTRRARGDVLAAWRGLEHPSMGHPCVSQAAFPSEMPSLLQIPSPWWL